MRSCSSLPDELIVDILSRLPAKSVGRCRCVSKTWRSMLSDPEFIRNHFNLSRNLLEEFLIFANFKAFRGDKGSLYSMPLESAAHQVFDEITLFGNKFSFPGYPDFWAHVQCSCDGLLLVESRGYMVFVLNPTTGEVREVPPFQIPFDPGVSYTRFALGYDSVRNDYKVVTISCYEDVENGEMSMNIYSLKTGTWKVVESSFYSHSNCTLMSPGIFMHGCIHWIACTSLDCKHAIVAFDLAEENFRVIPAPPNMTWLENQRLAILGGHLCTFNGFDDDIWIMKEYGNEESWTRFTAKNLDEGDVFTPYSLLEQEELVMFYETQHGSELVIRNLKEGTMKKIVVRGIPKHYHPRASFVESLISPHGGDVARGG